MKGKCAKNHSECDGEENICPIDLEIYESENWHCPHWVSGFKEKQRTMPCIGMDCGCWNQCRKKRKQKLISKMINEFRTSNDSSRTGAEDANRQGCRWWSR